MTAFDSEQTAYEVFGELFEILTADDNFNARLAENGLTVRLVHTRPDCVLHVSPGQVRTGADAPADATVAIRMSCDTAHKLWSGTLLMPAAVATGRVRIKGKVAKVLELVPILQPAFDRYPEIAARRGVQAAA